MVEQLGSVLSVGGRPEDVHHHEVLYVILLPTRLLQLVYVVPFTLTLFVISPSNGSTDV